MSKVGNLRMIKKGSQVWSIHNQANIILTEDSIVEVGNTCHGNDYVFVKPMQLLFALTIPGICGRSKDEWSVSYENTEHYEVPPPQLMNFTYNYNSCSCDNGVIDCPGCEGEKPKFGVCAGCEGAGRVTCGKCGGKKERNE
jgi:hypothetical protein